jgi:hypothetical protein
MDVNNFLKKLLNDQEVKEESKETTALEDERKRVEAVVNKEYATTKPTIEYGGSKAKDTMIMESYDLDLPIYFACDVRSSESLEEIYNDMAKCLEKEYYVERKRSALRLKKKGNHEEHEDFRIDVVPGRYTDSKKSDSYLYVNDSTDKERLKTNLRIHIAHVKESGFVDEIRLLKLWKVRNSIDVKTFILERNITYFWKHLRDKIDSLTLEDPANPTGNDLSKIFNDNMKADLKAAATSAIKKNDQENGWYAVFGERIPDTKILQTTPYVSPQILRSKPYCWTSDGEEVDE